ncbi:MAG: imidazole glycerol phosphate synthase subunit HisH [Cyanobacteria bacterium P01_C01_bin.89]
MAKIAVIDYDMGNLHSACKGLAQAGATPVVTESAQEIEAADAVVLPGVGAFDYAMEQVRAKDLEGPIRGAIASGKPFLGICVGLQMLFDRSEEGQQPGLGIIPGVVRRFASEPGVTIPHMGWNALDLAQPDCSLWNEMGDAPWMYFVHSYYVDPEDKSIRAATVTHGSQTITAAVQGQFLGSPRPNLMAVQFHPEKSSTAGLKALANFVEIVRTAVPC